MDQNQIAIKTNNLTKKFGGRIAVDQLNIKIRKGEIFSLLGTNGAGKTTLINYLLGEIPSDIDVGLINNTHIPASQFIKLVCREFELDISGLDRTTMIDRFHEFLLEMKWWLAKCWIFFLNY